MRLTQSEIDSIRSIATSIFGDCKVYLFGSRVLDNARGGDIDLLIQTKDLSDSFSKKLVLKSQLKREIGDQKIDVIIRSKNQFNEAGVIYQEALNGVML